MNGPVNPTALDISDTNHWELPLFDFADGQHDNGFLPPPLASVETFDFRPDGHRSGALENALPSLDLHGGASHRHRSEGHRVAVDENETWSHIREAVSRHFLQPSFEHLLKMENRIKELELEYGPLAVQGLVTLTGNRLNNFKAENQVLRQELSSNRSFCEESYKRVQRGLECSQTNIKRVDNKLNDVVNTINVIHRRRPR